MNKITARFSAPYIIMGVVGASTVVGATVIKAQENEYIAEMQRNNTYVEDSMLSDSMYLALIVAGLLAVFVGFAAAPDYAHRTANVLAEKYLRDMMKKYPELKQYESVLSNKNSLSALTTLICNGLDKETGKQIIAIVRGADNISNEDEPETKKDNMVKKIFDIVNMYASKHPEYVQETIRTLKAMKDIDLTQTYVIKNVQNTTEDVKH